MRVQQMSGSGAKAAGPKSDFPMYGQTARFGTAGNDRQGFGAAAYGNNLAYVQVQGDGLGTGSVVLETFKGDYSAAAPDTANWTGNQDFQGGPPTGSITIPSPNDVDGFGYGVALNDKFLVVGAKWSQKVMVYDLSGKLLRTIDAPADDDRTEIDNFGESIALDGSKLVIGAPNTAVDGFDDAGAAFILDLSDSSSEPRLLLAPVGDASISEGALAGQSVAIHGVEVAVGLPGFSPDSGDHRILTGLVQLYSAETWKFNLSVDQGDGSYPPSPDPEPSRAGLGRSLAFSNDGKALYASNPSWDSSPSWSTQQGFVLSFETSTGKLSQKLIGPSGSYFGGSLAVGDSEAGTDTLLVSYVDEAGNGRVAGYAAPGDSQQLVLKSTIKPFDSRGDKDFGASGILGGAVVPYSVKGQDGAVHRRLLVTAKNYVYNFENQLDLDLQKSADPSDDARVFPGQKITYTLTANNPNPTTSVVTTLLSDDLSSVLPYAQNGTVDGLTASFDPSGPSQPEAPTFDQTEKKVSWKGDIPGLTKLVIKYSITIKKSNDANYYTNKISNGFASDRSNDSPSTTNELGKIDVVKELQDPDGHVIPSGSALAYDQDYKYVITMTNKTDTAVDHFTASDDLSAVVDDAVINQAGIIVEGESSGAEYDTNTHIVSLSASLPANGKAVATIPFHTNKLGSPHPGDGKLSNAVVNAFGPDSNTVVHTVVEPDLTKGAYGSPTSDKTISSADVGQKVYYRIVLTNVSDVSIGGAGIDDDLNGVLKFADGPDDLSAVSSDSGRKLSDPTFNSDKKLLSWLDNGRMKPKESVTISYSVKIKQNVPQGSVLNNSATSPQTSKNPKTSVEVNTGTKVSALPLTGDKVWFWAILAILAIAILGIAQVIRGRGQTIG